jgi:glycosyltransferase involved in cell wall biosynthesis
MAQAPQATARYIVVSGLSARTGGGLTYLRELLPRLERELRGPGIRVHLLISGDAQQELADGLRDSSISVHSPIWAGRSGLVRLLGEQVVLPGMLRRLSADVVFHTGDTIPLASRVPDVLLCRNMLLYEPRGKHSLRLRALALLARCSIRRASAVAFVSHTLAESVLTRSKPRHWTVIHHGPGLAVEPTDRPPVGDPVVLVVSSLYDYKRVEVAIQAVVELRQRGLLAQLSVIGRPIETRYVQYLHALVDRLDARLFVRFAGEMDAASTAEAYTTATLAMVTSQNESFCHPILEALAAGVPVVVPTDLPVAHEIAADAAAYADPDGSAFADAAEALLRNDVAYKERVLAGIRQAATFSWDRTALQTAGLLVEAMKR